MESETGDKYSLVGEEASHIKIPYTTAHSVLQYKWGVLWNIFGCWQNREGWWIFCDVWVYKMSIYVSTRWLVNLNTFSVCVCVCVCFDGVWTQELAPTSQMGTI